MDQALYIEGFYDNHQSAFGGYARIANGSKTATCKAGKRDKHYAKKFDTLAKADYGVDAKNPILLTATDRTDKVSF